MPLTCLRVHAVRSLVPGQPTLATCDLVQLKLLEPVSTFYHGNRQFALFRPNLDMAVTSGKARRNVADGGATRHSAAGSRCWQTGAGCGLPCAPRCTLRWHSPEQQRSWRRHEKALYPAQRRLREADCKVADDTHEMGRKDGDASEVKGAQQ